MFYPNSDYLNHSFYFERHSVIISIYYATCKNCQIKIVYRDQDDSYWEIIRGSYKRIRLNINCDEYIIKNIIE